MVSSRSSHAAGSTLRAMSIANSAGYDTVVPLAKLTTTVSTASLPLTPSRLKDAWTTLSSDASSHAKFRIPASVGVLEIFQVKEGKVRR